MCQFEHNFLYWLCKYLICFFNVYFLKILGFVIKKLHFRVMDSKISMYESSRGSYYWTRKNIIYIPREPCINEIAQREFYIDSILYWGDKHCVEQICMKLVVLYNLCDVLTSRDLLQSTQNVSIREQVIVFLQIRAETKDSILIVVYTIGLLKLSIVTLELY